MPGAAAALLMAASFLPPAAGAQTRPAPVLDNTPTRDGRPLPGPVFETPDFTRAVARGTRTRSGRPGSAYWTQYARYRIEATLAPAADRLSGRERVVYLNRSPDTLSMVALYLRQNVFAPGSPRVGAAPVTGGVTLERVLAAGTVLAAEPASNPALPVTASPPGRPGRGRYAVDGTVMWIRLPRPLLPRDSVSLELAWSFTPPPAPPSDGREGHESSAAGDVWMFGYWYPQLAVYDDVDGWVTDPYLNGAEFYMGHGDYDVRLTVPHGWPVGATGVLQNPGEVLSARSRGRLAEARATGRVVNVVTPGPDADAAFTPGGTTATWHFVANDVRDFAWGTGDRYVWDATRALVDQGRDTVAIHSLYRLHAPAAAWAVGGARFTRDAIERLSDYLWPYPWPVMTSLEGVLDGGGMEYPMATAMQPWADTLSLAGDLIHETGHMWFPMQVGSSETRYPWMDEGLTQFDAAQAMRAIYGEPREGGRANDSEPGQRASYLDRARAGQEAVLMRHGDRFPRDLYFTMHYNKTSQVLAALRGVLGEETFHRALREYGRRWTGKHPRPFDLFNAFDDVAGRDLSWFWRTWFFEPWSLDQALVAVEERGDSVDITVEDRGLAPMPIRLAVTRADGTVQRFDVPVDVWLGGARRHVVRVAREPAVVSVEIDPEEAFPDIDRGNQVTDRKPNGT